MWVEQVPADWFMSKFLFGFSQRAPAPEDAPIRAYLAAHRLEPRWQRGEEVDGEPYEVLCYGECYIRAHLRAIADLYREHAAPPDAASPADDVASLPPAGADPAPAEER